MTPTPASQHLTPDEIELWAQGLLPAARDAHVARCDECRAVAGRERKLFRELAKLTRFTPELGFVERVIAKLRALKPTGRHFSANSDTQHTRRAIVAHTH